MADGHWVNIKRPSIFLRSISRNIATVVKDWCSRAGNYVRQSLGMAVKTASRASDDDIDFQCLDVSRKERETGVTTAESGIIRSLHPASQREYVQSREAQRESERVLAEQLERDRKEAYKAIRESDPKLKR